MAQAQGTFSPYYELDFQRRGMIYHVKYPLDNTGSVTSVYTTLTLSAGQINTFTTGLYLRPGMPGNPTNYPKQVADITWNSQNSQVSIQLGWKLTDAGRAIEPPTINDQLSLFDEEAMRSFTIQGRKYSFKYGGNKVNVYCDGVRLGFIYKEPQNKLIIALLDNNTSGVSILKNPIRALKLLLAAICLLNPSEPSV